MEPDALFVYGSLQFPEVLHALLGRIPNRSKGAVQGWRVAELPNEVYPGLVADEGSTAQGLVIADLSAEEWRVVDAFENNLYALQRLTLTDGRYGWGYTCPAGTDVSPSTWSPDHFVIHHLAAYVKNCHAWRERYDARREAS